MCSACEGYLVSSCPVCGRGSREEVECPKCHGVGHGGYFAFDIIKREAVKCTENAWLTLPEDEDDADRLGKRYCRMPFEACDRCDGEGVILR